MHIEEHEQCADENYFYGSHKNDILVVLRTGSTITQPQALMWFGCMRLAARIHELRKEGWHITTKMVGEGQRKIAEYQLQLEHLA